MSPERYYAQFGYTRAPTEGAFHFRWRCEVMTDLVVDDPNPLRERLYQMWCWRTGHARDPLTRRAMADVSAMLMQSVMEQFASIGTTIGDG